MDAVNPIIPTSWEFFITVVGLIQLILLIIAVVRVGRDPWLKPEHKIFLLLVSLLVPLLGPALSLLVVFRTNKR